MITKVSQNTIDKVQYFKKHTQAQGYGEGHFVFACHAAFPIALTPDLLQQLWANFKIYEDNWQQPTSINILAISDLLLSPLCREVRREVFEMDVETRAQLLNALETDVRFGRARMKKVAYFLYQYTQEIAITKHNKAFVDAQTWTALATIAPQQAANQIAAALKMAVDTRNDNEVLRMRNLLESYSNQEAAFENLLHYTKGLKAHIMNYPMEVVQQQFNQAGAKVLTIEEGAAVTDTLLEIPMLESLEAQVEVAAETLRSTAVQKAQARIEKEAEALSGQLDLSGLNLKTIPEGVFDLLHLKELDLYDNKLRSIPTALSKLTQLEKLYLSKNAIQTLPSALSQLSNLKEIKLDEGRLKRFPEVLLRLKNLENISLENNNIEFVPPAVAKLKNLKLFDVRENPVVNIPKKFHKRTGQGIRDYFKQFEAETKGKPVFLLITHDPDKEIQVEEEIAIIENALGHSIESEELELIIKQNIDLLELFQTLQVYRKRIKILHIAAFHLNVPNEAGTPIELHPKLFQKLVGDLTACELLVMNVCDSKEHAELVTKEIDMAAIGIDGKISDRDAIHFTKELYKELKDGKSIQAAFDAVAIDFTMDDFGNYSSNMMEQVQQVKMEKESAASLLHLFPLVELEALKSRVQGLVASNKLKLAIILLRDALVKNSTGQHEILALQSRFFSEEKSFSEGIIDERAYSLTQNQLNAAILEQLSTLKETDLKTHQFLANSPFPKTRTNLNDQLNRSAQPMPVLLLGTAEHKDLFKTIYNKIRSPHLRLLEAGVEGVNYSLEVNGQELTIHHTNDQQLIHGIKDINDATVEYIKTKLETIEKWHRIQQLENDSFLEKDVSFQFYREEENGQLTKYSEAEIYLTIPDVSMSKEEPSAIWYQIKAQNNATQDLYFSLLYLSSDFSIHNYYPCNLTPAKSKEIVLDDQHGLAINRPQDKTNTDVFLLIASTKSFDDSQFVDKGLEIGVSEKLPRERGIQKRGGYTMQENSDNQEWFTKKITVHLRREERRTKFSKKRRKI